MLSMRGYWVVNALLRTASDMTLFDGSALGSALREAHWEAHWEAHFGPPGTVRNGPTGLVLVASLF